MDDRQISSSSIRLFGNGGGMLPETVSAAVEDDLQENAIRVMDGGDGFFNPGDYFLFYAPGEFRRLRSVLDFSVKKADELMQELLNYPNPVTGSTRFCFTLKMPGQKLGVTVNIFNPHGQLIKSIQQTINGPMNRSCEIEWDGLDARGIKVKPGIYIYKVELKLANGTKDNKSKKLIVI